MKCFDSEADHFETLFPSATADLQQKLPRKIIFCLDVSNELSQSIRPSASGGIKGSNLYSSTAIEAIQRYLKRYIHINSMLAKNNNDEYGVILLKDTAKWWLKCTSDVDLVLHQLNLLETEVNEHKQYKSLDLESIYSAIDQNIDILEMEKNKAFCQCILVYGRYAVPKPVPKDSLYRTRLRNSSHFTLDVILLHDRSNESRNTIYEILNSMDSEESPGWYYEMSFNYAMDKLALATAKLVGHPLQRQKKQYD